MFIQNHIISFLSYLKHERRFSEHTILAYGHDLNDFESFLTNEFSIEAISDISHKQVRTWVVAMMNNGMVPKTINRKISSLRSFYKFLLSRKEVEQNPLKKISGLKTPGRLPKFLDEKDIHRLCTEIVYPEGFEGLRDKLIIELFYNTGMRLSELVGILEQDFDIYNSSIKVLGKGKKERIIPVHHQLVKEMETYLTSKHALFGHHNQSFFLTDKGESIYSKMVYRKIKHYLGLVTTLDKKSPHVLRHTFATHLLNNGAELNAVKELLGHASLAATQVYTHNTIQKLKDVHKQAHPKS